MVAARCRALTSAARWNGHAPQTATGAASASDSHCQFRNCSAGAIASTTTGTARTSETSKRCRNPAISSGSGTGPASSARGGTGSAAV